MKRHFIGYSTVWVTKAGEAIKHLQTDTFKYVFLDHDLAEDHYKSFDVLGTVDPNLKGTGQDVADWIAYHKVPLEGIIIHSLNPVGSKNMNTVLTKTGYNVKLKPGFWNNHNSISEII